MRRRLQFESEFQKKISEVQQENHMIWIFTGYFYINYVQLKMTICVILKIYCEGLVKQEWKFISRSHNDPRRNWNIYYRFELMAIVCTIKKDLVFVERKKITVFTIKLLLMQSDIYDLEFKNMHVVGNTFSWQPANPTMWNEMMSHIIQDRRILWFNEVLKSCGKFKCLVK